MEGRRSNLIQATNRYLHGMTARGGAEEKPMAQDLNPRLLEYEDDTAASLHLQPLETVFCFMNVNI
jgi:hypothetical protein